MEKANKPMKYPWKLAPLYMLNSASMGVFQTYFMPFLQHEGIDNATIGSIMAAAPIAAMIGQPLWGFLADRVKYKNTIMTLLIVVSAVIMALMPASNTAAYFLVMVCAFSAFQNAIFPMLDTISLETLDKGGFSFGPLRITVSIAYAVAAPLAGLFIQGRYGLSPYFVAGFMLVSAAASLAMPKVQGHQKKHEKVPYKALLTNKPILLMTLFIFFLQMAMTFYYTYFAQYFISPEVGGTSALLGWAFFINAMSEIPFLFVSDKLMKKLGVARMLMIPALTLVARFLLLSFLYDKYWILATQMLHCGCFAVITFTLAKFVNNSAPPELKATGQMMVSIFGMGLSRAVGAFVAGRIVAASGIRTSFVFAGGLSAFAFLLILVVMLCNKEMRMAGREEMKTL